MAKLVDAKYSVVVFDLYYDKETVMKLNAIRTTHNLDFLATLWDKNPTISLFKIGTCHGQYFFTITSIKIISIINESPGNGHLDDVFEWFEYSAKRHNLNLVICEFFNEKFKKHCIEKRGFKPINENDVIKYFR